MRLRLTPPDDLAAEEWLRRWDNSPQIVPRWPASKKVAVVGVAYPDGPDGSSVAWIYPRREDLAALATHEFASRVMLFFRVPRSIVLAGGVAPPELAKEWA